MNEEMRDFLCTCSAEQQALAMGGLSTVLATVRMKNRPLKVESGKLVPIQLAAASR